MIQEHLVQQDLLDRKDQQDHLARQDHLVQLEALVRQDPRVQQVHLVNRARLVARDPLEGLVFQAFQVRTEVQVIQVSGAILDQLAQQVSLGRKALKVKLEILDPLEQQGLLVVLALLDLKVRVAA